MERLPCVPVVYRPASLDKLRDELFLRHNRLGAVVPRSAPSIQWLTCLCRHAAHLPRAQSYCSSLSFWQVRAFVAGARRTMSRLVDGSSQPGQVCATGQRRPGQSHAVVICCHIESVLADRHYHSLSICSQPPHSPCSSSTSYSSPQLLHVRASVAAHSAHGPGWSTASSQPGVRCVRVRPGHGSYVSVRPRQPK